MIQLQILCFPEFLVRGPESMCASPRLLRRIQRHRCAQSGKRLWKTAEVDHRVPLFQVWRERRDTAWPELLGFWGLPNLQVINRDIHALKCAGEATYRSRRDVAADAPDDGLEL